MIDPEVQALVDAAGEVERRGLPVTAETLGAASDRARTLLAARLAVVSGDGLQVYVEYSGDAEAAREALTRIGARIEAVAADRGLIQATVSIKAIGDVRALPMVTRVRLPEYGIHN